jgi:hypothetical protein
VVEGLVSANASFSETKELFNSYRSFLHFYVHHPARCLFPQEMCIWCACKSALSDSFGEVWIFSIFSSLGLLRYFELEIWIVFMLYLDVSNRLMAKG